MTTRTWPGSRASLVPYQPKASSAARSVISKGSVAGHPDQHGKAVWLEMTVKGGRIEDLLFLFTNENRPSMTGSINLRAKVQVPPGPPGFMRKLDLTGSCGIATGRFTN